MAKPTKPTVPPAPLRSQPDTFSARAETFLAFWPDFATYLDGVADFTDEQADAALAAALGGDLPALTGKALQYLRVNAGETGAEFASAVPAGTVIYHAADTAPTGYIKANGAAISRTTYAALFAAIGTTFGVGDGSTTFTLPDLRGEFARGWDDGRGVDSGRAFGSAQLDRMQGHYHGAGGGLGITENIGAGTSIGVRNGGTQLVLSPSTDGTNGTPRTGADTRPRNVALLACIKF